MSAYIYCPKCKEDTLDVDTLSCDCGFSPDKEIIRLTAELNETFAKMVVLKSKNAELSAELENEKKERLINANAGRMQKERAEDAEQQVVALVEIFEKFRISHAADKIIDEALSTLPDRAKKIQAVVEAAKKYAAYSDGLTHGMLLHAIRDLES